MRSTALTDTDKNTTGEYRYDPFGAVMLLTENTNCYFMFTGRRYDALSEAYYYRSRQYDQTAGRFIRNDDYHGNDRRSITLNRYIYVLNNPTNNVDPMGMCVPSADCITAGSTATCSEQYDVCTSDPCETEYCINGRYTNLMEDNNVKTYMCTVGVWNSWDLVSETGATGNHVVKHKNECSLWCLLGM